MSEPLHRYESSGLFPELFQASVGSDIDEPAADRRQANEGLVLGGRSAVSMFPAWLKVLFLCGLLSLIASMVGLLMTPLVANGAFVSTLFFTAAAGVAALWIVARVAPGCDVRQ